MYVHFMIFQVNIKTERTIVLSQRICRGKTFIVVNCSVQESFYNVKYSSNDQFQVGLTKVER